MLLVGDARCIPNDIDNLVVLNLSSLAEGYERVHLVPSIPTMYNNERDFSLHYANFIFSNDAIFMELMKIVYPLYCGYNVFLIVSRSENTYDIVTESLCKLIQQRYGYNYQLINCIDDIDYYDESSFSLNGIQVFDIDKEKMTYLAVSQNPDLIGGEDAI